MQVHLTKVSTNVKTGPMPVSTTSKASCPSNCSLKGNGCYAESGPLGIHWAAVTNGKRGTDWATFCDDVRKLPRGVVWRHNQAGDLPGDTMSINVHLLNMLIAANKGKKGFTYTHYDVINNESNAQWVSIANKEGFTVNLSAESYHDADKLAELNIGPVVTIQAEGMPHVTFTPKGRKVITCPATYRDNVSCYTCKLCQKQDRPIIAFPVHGVSKKKAAKVFQIKSI